MNKEIDQCKADLHEVKPIEPGIMPYDLDAKIFYDKDEDGNAIGEPYSYNDQVQMLRDMAGFNEDLMGKA